MKVPKNLVEFLLWLVVSRFQPNSEVEGLAKAPTVLEINLLRAAPPTSRGVNSILEVSLRVVHTISFADIQETFPSDEKSHMIKESNDKIGPISSKGEGVFGKQKTS